MTAGDAWVEPVTGKADAVWIEDEEILVRGTVRVVDATMIRVDFGLVTGPVSVPYDRVVRAGSVPPPDEEKRIEALLHAHGEGQRSAARDIVLSMRRWHGGEAWTESAKAALEVIIGRVDYIYLRGVEAVHQAEDSAKGGDAMRASGEKPCSVPGRGVVAESCPDNERSHVTLDEPDGSAPALREVGRSGGAEMQGVDPGAACASTTRREEGGIDARVWLSLDRQGVARGIFRSREACEEDARTYGDGTWEVYGPYQLQGVEPPRLSCDWCDKPATGSLCRAHFDSAAALQARPFDDWSEELGPVLWWSFPVEEPPYAGTPLDDDFPEYMTHWTPIVVPAAPCAGSAADPREAEFRAKYERIGVTLETSQKEAEAGDVEGVPLGAVDGSEGESRGAQSGDASASPSPPPTPSSGSAPGDGARVIKYLNDWHLDEENEELWRPKHAEARALIELLEEVRAEEREACARIAEEAADEAARRATRDGCSADWAAQRIRARCTAKVPPAGGQGT